MKNLFQNLAALFFMLFILLMAPSCENNSLDEATDENVTQVEEYPESKLISFDEIERITSTVSPNELSYGIASKNQTIKNASRENTTYYFYGAVNEGDLSGYNLSGELQVSVTLYSGVFKILRGKFISSNGEESDARGAILADGTVYLVLEMKDDVLVFGIGKENADTKGIVGSFSLFTTDGSISKGTWLANPKDIDTPSDTLVDILSNDSRGRFTTLIAAIETAGLSDTLKAGGPFVIFAPTNDAFAALDSLPEGDALKNVLLHHVVNGKLDTRAISAKETLTPLFGEDLTIGFNGTLFTVNETVQIIHSNIEASNGYIHAIDAVLVP